MMKSLPSFIDVARPYGRPGNICAPTGRKCWVPTRPLHSHLSRVHGNDWIPIGQIGRTPFARPRQRDIGSFKRGGRREGRDARRGGWAENEGSFTAGRESGFEKLGHAGTRRRSHLAELYEKRA